MPIDSPPVLKSMRSKRILIVDDFHPFARSIRRRLVRAGFEHVEIAHNAEEVWKRLRELEPDVVLMDINLGERCDDGLVLLGKMQREGYEGLSVVVSGDESIHQLYRALDAGANDYWCKGVHLNIVLEMVELLSRPRRLETEEWTPEDVAVLGYFRTRGVTPAVRRVVCEYSRDFPRYKVLGERLGRSPKQLRKVMADLQDQLGLDGQGQLASVLTVCGIMGKRSRD
jgi:DNA-binding NtrC family response regulator